MWLKVVSHVSLPGLNINANSPEWFLLGMVAMKLQRLQLALKAFTRVVQQDPTQSSAWANLASIYLHMDQFERSLTAMEQAVRRDASDWRMWANFVTAATRMKNYSKAIHGMRKLVELRKPPEYDGLDLDALTVLVEDIVVSCAAEAQHREQQQLSGDEPPVAPVADPAATPISTNTPIMPTVTFSDDAFNDEFAAEAEEEETTSAERTEPSIPGVRLDCNGNSCSVHLPRVVDLLKHITSRVSNHPRVWELFAAVQTAVGDEEGELECRMKQCRSLQLAEHWEREDSQVAEVVSAAQIVVDCFMNLGTVSRLKEAAMFVQSVINKIRAGGVFGEASEHLQKLSEQAVRITNQLQSVEAQSSAPSTA